jgi:hypothetical protein
VDKPFVLDERSVLAVSYFGPQRGGAIQQFSVSFYAGSVASAEILELVFGGMQQGGGAW